MNRGCSLPLDALDLKPYLCFATVRSTRFGWSCGEGWMNEKMSWTTKVIIGSSVLAASLAAGGGIAAASPDVSALITSTCTYPQVIDALNAQAPEAANDLSSSSMASAWLQQLVAAPPEERQQMVAQVQDMPAFQEYITLIPQVAQTCNNY